MHAPQRRDVPVVIDRLLAEPQQFDFFQAVRLIDRWMGMAAPDGQGLTRLNFRNSLSLSFPPSQIEALQVHWRREPDGGTPQVERIDLTPAFMGLLGVNGSLPLFYTEALAQRELYQKDASGRAFMDLFSHRAVALFYEAWRKHRLAVQFEADRRNRFLPLVLSIAGLGHKGLRDRLRAPGGGVPGIPDEALAFHAATLQRRILSAAQLQRVLQDHFRVPIAVEQFAGRWVQIPASGRACLRNPLPGRAGATGFQGVLGRSAVLGERVWQRDLRVRIVIGPLKHERFRRFLPGGAAAQALASLLTMLSGVSLEYEVELSLCREDVRGPVLASRRAPQLSRLGWDTFLQTGPANEDRMDVRYAIHAAA